MKAVVLERRGKTGVHFQDHPTPTPKPGHALVRLEAASLNRVDAYMRDNGVGITHSLPMVMGVDGVGRIEQINGPSPLQIGQRVILYPYEVCGTCDYCLQGNQPLCTTAKIPGEHIDGTFADYISMPLTSLIPLSEEANREQAACLGVAYLTAWRMIFTKAKASAGKTVLIVGAGGGVSCASVQLAKLAGCEVIATTTGADKIKKVQDVGADYVVDYRDHNAVKQILALTHKQGVDFAIDNVGEATWADTLKCVKRGGDVVTCGATTGGHPSADLQRLFIRQLSLHGSTMGDLQEFSRLIKTFESGLLRPVIDSVFPISDIKIAFDRLEDPTRFGKVVITM